MDAKHENRGPAPSPTLSRAAPPELRWVLMREMAALLAEPATGPGERPDEGRRTVLLPGFLLWSLAGLYLFSRDRFPALREAGAHARRTLLLLAWARCRGKISPMAALLGTSRHIVREGLKAAGLYGGREDPPETDPDPTAPTAPIPDLPQRGDPRAA